MQDIPIRELREVQISSSFLDNFSIRDIQPLLRDSDLVQELHRHDFYYILIIEKGRGSHQIDFTSYPVKDRTLFFMRPGQVHQHQLKQGSLAHIIAFSTPQEKITQQLVRKASSLNHYALKEAQFQQLQILTAYLLREVEQKSTGYELVIKAMIEAMLVELIRVQHTHTNAQFRPYSQEKLDAFMALLEKHIHKYKQVAQYAAHLNLSPYQLNAITKSTVGKTPSSVINDHIILEAKRYLLATNNQVNQVAQHLGYEDVSYFIRFFKKHTKFTPEAYRQNFA